MSGEQWGEAVDAAWTAADQAIDAIEQRNGLAFNGMFDPEVKEIARAVLDAVAPLIVADIRQQIAADIEALRARLDEGDVWENEGRSYLAEAANIASGGGNGDSGQEGT